MAYSSNRIFLLLAAISAYLIWFVSVRNGLITACETASVTKKLPDGTPLRTKYTGIPPIDFVVTTQVIFFHEIILSQPWLLINGFSLAFAIIVCQMIESGRAAVSNRKSVTSVGTWNVAGQHTGVGMINPIYYYYHATHTEAASAAGQLAPPTSSFVRAILPAVALGGVLPCYLLTLWAPKLDTDSYQIALGALQPFALVTSALHILFAGILPGRSRPSGANDLRLTYVVTMVFAAVVHNIARLHFLEPEVSPGAFSWVSLYLPTTARVGTLAETVSVFMRNDVLVLGWGAVLWGWLMLLRDAEWGAVTAGIFSVVGYVLLGPGATLVGAMWLREEWLLSRAVSTKSK